MQTRNTNLGGGALIGGNGNEIFYTLTYSTTGSLVASGSGISGGTSIPLTVSGTLTADELARYPQLAAYTVLELPGSIQLCTIKEALTGEFAVSTYNESGALQYATGVQFAPVLDDLYYYPGRLGVVFHHAHDDSWNDWANDQDCDVKLKLWAPTAQSVSLQIFDAAADTSPSSTIAMHQHEGVWVADGGSDWKGKYYLYNVKVWVPADSAVDSNVTTDPYSIDIALNGTKSRITDLGSNDTKPAGWDSDVSPSLRSLSDISLYELHNRDFSIDDPTVSVAHRGTYDAFADQNSNGMRHLRALAASGLTTIHILPSFHFGTVNEDKSTGVIPNDLAQYPRMEVHFTDSRLQGLSLQLHPVQRSSNDPATRQSTFNSKEGTATVAALTTAVFFSDI